MKIGTHAWERIDRLLVQPIDAADNGMTTARWTTEVRPFTLSTLVDVFNPAWDESTSFDDQFTATVQLAREVLERVAIQAVAWVLARERIELALQEADQVLVLEEPLPWSEHVVENPAAEQVLYVVYPSSRNWMVQTVPPELGSFEQKKPLPAAWAGRNGADLEQLTGVEGAVFCHRKAFVCGAQTREGALEMARLAVAASTPESAR